jgi:hypothetical protein
MWRSWSTAGRASSVGHSSGCHRKPGGLSPRAGQRAIRILWRILLPRLEHVMADVPEGELLEACQQGRVLDCADGGIRRAVDAALLRHCCHSLQAQVDPRGMRLQNAMIVGCLDLAGLDVPFPVRFEGCEFDTAPTVEGARLQELALTGCTLLPGLLANGLRVRRDLDLSRSRVTGGHLTSASTSRRSAIWLCESDIGGRLLFRDTIIDADGERSLQADRMHVGGTVRFLHNFTARGEMRLLGARIDGTLDLTGARIESPSGHALNLNYAIIGGSFFLVDGMARRRPVITGRIDMSSAQIFGQFLIRNATLEEPGITPTDSVYSSSRLGGTVLSAPRLAVGAELTLEGTCKVTGGLDLSMSDLSSLSVGGDCSLRAPGRTALNLTNAALRSSLIIASGAAVQGTTRLTGAHIRGSLSLRGATLDEPESGSLVAAQGAIIDGDVDLQHLHATGGQVGFRGATLGSAVDAAGARLANPGGLTLNLHQATVRGSVRLVDGFESAGLVRLARSTIEGRLRCSRGSFSCPAPSERNPEGHAIEATSATIRGGMDLGWATSTPSVDLTNASTTFLADDPANWPPRFSISGFSYDLFEQPQGGGTRQTWDRAARCAWLSRQAVYDSGPYEQAARVFRQHGYTSEAEEILIAQRRQARRGVGSRAGTLGRALDSVYDLTVRYGYRPERVLWLLAALLVLVVVSLEIPAGQATLRATTSAGAVFTTTGPLGAGRAGAAAPASTAGPRATPKAAAAAADACGGGQVRCFNPVLFAIDTVIPLVSLDQRAVWYPDPQLRDGSFMQWWLNIATLLGWLLSSIFVLSLARITRAT